MMILIVWKLWWKHFCWSSWYLWSGYGTEIFCDYTLYYVVTTECFNESISQGRITKVEVTIIELKWMWDTTFGWFCPGPGSRLTLVRVEFNVTEMKWWETSHRKHDDQLCFNFWTLFIHILYYRCDLLQCFRMGLLSVLMRT